MARHNGSAPLFDEDDIASVKRYLPRLIRIVFLRLEITRDEYLERYKRFMGDIDRDKTPRELSDQATVDRKVIMDQKLTFNKFQHVMRAMGYDVEAVQVRLRDRVSGKSETFSTDETIEDINQKIAQSRDFSLRFDD